jgi:hypothetical protein
MVRKMEEIHNLTDIETRQVREYWIGNAWVRLQGGARVMNTSISGRCRIGANAVDHEGKDW